MFDSVCCFASCCWCVFVACFPRKCLSNLAMNDDDVVLVILGSMFSD